LLLKTAHGDSRGLEITKAGRDALRRECEALRQILASTPDTDDAHDSRPNPAPTTA
jgi:hypothetical protein